jgi:hypothetical protein
VTGTLTVTLTADAGGVLQLKGKFNSGCRERGQVSVFEFHGQRKEDLAPAVPVAPVTPAAGKAASAPSPP